MAKEKSVNPAQAQRKAEKQKALKKGKAQVQAQRTERLAQRNPNRLEKQVEELKSLQESSGGSLNPRDKKQLEDLERDLKAVRKAREALGDKAPVFGGPRRDGDGAGRGAFSKGRGRGDFRGGRGGFDGRRRGGNDSDTSTEEGVRDIPMPRDTPPPIDPEVIKVWREEQFKKRQARRDAQAANMGTAANNTPLGTGPNGERLPHRLPNRSGAGDSGVGEDVEMGEQNTIPERKGPAAVTTYSAAPIIRDLRKEAASAFVPAAVRNKIKAQKGEGGRLLEPEELERLERSGYGGSGSASGGQSDAKPTEIGSGSGMAVNAAPEVDEERLEDEERAFERELRGVQIEEVSDEEG